ncbi:germacrene-D synthase-like [Olea europaea subsp. europaea]|uniref:Germacrene-D synthase-like n=1 Tax=Olea europaea subsp. europaea TaxID=158383 RepID=A0A8S0TYL8_OLEEU|nr:germacrene-D synthase-like [Olea europaea subsp. europaea]
MMYSVQQVGAEMIIGVKMQTAIEASTVLFSETRFLPSQRQSNVFNKFKDHKGNFDESLISNAQALLILYEAAQIRVRGEETLEEALKFSTTQINSPIHRKFRAQRAMIKGIGNSIFFSGLCAISRLGARKFISIYQEDEPHNEIILNFSISNIITIKIVKILPLDVIVRRWWKALDIENKLPFARDRLVKCYFWALTIYFEPQYAIGRKVQTKIIAMLTTVDDIFDVYGTLDELTPFVDAIESWVFSVIDQLPTYMQHCYKALFDLYVKIEEELGKIEKSYLLHYVIEETKRLARSCFQEAKWVYSGCTPTLEEYLKVGKITSTYILLSAAVFAGTGELASKEAFEWITSDPLILQALEIICRLMNDMVGIGFEQKISAVECYMNQNKGATKEEAFAELEELVTDAWKDINEECLHPIVVPAPKTLLLEIIDNYARVTHLVYRYMDNSRSLKST